MSKTENNVAVTEERSWIRNRIRTKMSRMGSSTLVRGNQCSGSVTFWYRSRSALFVIDFRDTNKKFLIVLLFTYCLYIYISLQR
jgi:hypothetical protein